MVLFDLVSDSPHSPRVVTGFFMLQKYTRKTNAVLLFQEPAVSPRLMIEEPHRKVAQCTPSVMPTDAAMTTVMMVKMMKM